MTSNKTSLLIFLATFAVFCALTQVKAYSSSYCGPWSRCQGKTLYCPSECPSSTSDNPKDKVCRIDCYSPKCKAECKNPKANCNSPGSACYDPRFIGGDGIVFYFHGKVNEHFTLFSDTNLQINGRFIGHRPTGRARDFTWIQALGLLFNSHTFSLEATKSATWDQEIDHLKFTYDGQTISLPLGGLSTWKSPDNEIKIERTSGVNSVMVIIPGVVEILANVVPVTAEDDKIHGYNVPSDDCFAHLEVQFRFSGLSDNVEGVLGRTYQPDFKNPAKPGVAMAVVGGEDKYKTSGLLSSDCAKCIFDSGNVGVIAKEVIALDCSAKGYFHGNGIVCKK
ncbi:late embryogenesis abundant protein-related protein [Tanacetum coccineum]